MNNTKANGLKISDGVDYHKCCYLKSSSVPSEPTLGRLIIIRIKETAKQKNIITNLSFFISNTFEHEVFAGLARTYNLPMASW